MKNLDLQKIIIKYEKEIEQKKYFSKFYISDLPICLMYIQEIMPHIKFSRYNCNLFSDNFGENIENFYGPIDYAKYAIKNEVDKLEKYDHYMIRKSFGKYKKIYIYGYIIDNKLINPYTNNNMKIYQYIEETKNGCIFGSHLSLQEDNLQYEQLLDIWHPNKKIYTEQEMNQKINEIKDFTI